MKESVVSSRLKLPASLRARDIESVVGWGLLFRLDYGDELGYICIRIGGDMDSTGVER